MRSNWRAWPVLALLAEALVFFRQVLFYGHYAIPWDLRYYHFSQAAFAARSVAHGQLPLWDPYTYCGMPFYANLTAQVFYPPALFAILLSNWTGGRNLLYFLELQLIAHVVLAGALAYWLLRRIGAARAAAVAGATVYQLGCYTASQTQHLGAIDAAAWLPLAWLATVELRDAFRPRWVAGLALALAMSILAGFPAATAVVFVTCFLLAAAILSWRAAAMAAASAVWAVLLAAVQVFPTLQLSRLSVAQYRSDFLGTGGGMPLASLVSLVEPNHYGIFQFEGGTWKLPWDPTFLYTYCGIPALLFVALALVSRRSRYAPAFALVTFCAALWMLGDSTPAGRTVFLLLPDAAKRPLYAQFALCGFSLGMAVLAGLGADAFLLERSRWMQAAVLAVVAADLIGVSSGRPFNTVDERVDPGIAYDHYDRYREIPAEIRGLVNQNVPPWRMDLMGGPHDMVSAAPLFEYPTANGDDPFALVRLMQVRLSFCRGERWGRFYEVVDPDSPVLKLMNVRYLVSATTVDGDLTKVAELPGTVVYENPGTLPRFFLVNRVRAVDGMAAGVAALRSRDFDPRTEAVVEGAVPAMAGAAAGTVRVVEYGARQFTLRVKTAAPALLVTSEAAYPGWQASIDGRHEKQVLTNVAFRGLPVPAGDHTITMRFEPGILWISAWVTIAAGLVVVFAFTTKSGRWTSRSS